MIAIGRTGTMAMAGIFAVAGLGALALWPSASSEGGISSNLPPVDIAAGETIYAARCASCHGANMEGAPDWRTPGPDGKYPPPPHDETGHTWHHDDAMLFNYTKLGGDAAMRAQGLPAPDSGMPAFSDVLTDAEIRDVLAYIGSTWPERIRSARAARSGG